MKRDHARRLGCLSALGLSLCTAVGCASTASQGDDEVRLDTKEVVSTDIKSAGTGISGARKPGQGTSGCGVRLLEPAAQACLGDGPCPLAIAGSMSCPPAEGSPEPWASVWARKEGAGIFALSAGKHIGLVEEVPQRSPMTSVIDFKQPVTSAAAALTHDRKTLHLFATYEEGPEGHTISEGIRRGRGPWAFTRALSLPSNKRIWTLRAFPPQFEVILGGGQAEYHLLSTNHALPERYLLKEAGAIFYRPWGPRPLHTCLQMSEIPEGLFVELAKTDFPTNAHFREAYKLYSKGAPTGFCLEDHVSIAAWGGPEGDLALYMTASYKNAAQVLRPDPFTSSTPRTTCALPDEALRRLFPAVPSGAGDFGRAEKMGPSGPCEASVPLSPVRIAVLAESGAHLVIVLGERTQRVIDDQASAGAALDASACQADCEAPGVRARRIYDLQVFYAVKSDALHGKRFISTIWRGVIDAEKLPLGSSGDRIQALTVAAEGGMSRGLYLASSRAFLRLSYSPTSLHDHPMKAETLWMEPSKKAEVDAREVAAWSIASARTRHSEMNPLFERLASFPASRAGQITSKGFKTENRCRGKRDGVFRDGSKNTAEGGQFVGLSGRCRSGKMEGRWVRTERHGSVVWEAHYKGGRLHGQLSDYEFIPAYGPALRVSAHFKNGRLAGPYVNGGGGGPNEGQVGLQGQFESGLAEGIWTYGPNHSEAWKAGKLNGPASHDDGVLSIEAHYEDSTLHGAWLQKKRQGNKVEFISGQFHRGELDGVWRVGFEDDPRVLVLVWDKGRLISRKTEPAP